MKKKNLFIILVIVFLIMLIPLPLKLKDGGSTKYKSLLYSVTKIHKINYTSTTGYEDGWKVEILGIQVYNKTDIFIEVITIEELNNIQKQITDKLALQNDYNNFASCGVDEQRKVVVVELIDNSEEQQEWFKNNILDSKYIEFKQGGSYTTYNKKIEVIKPEVHNAIIFHKYLERDNKIIYLAGNIEEIYYTDADTRISLKDYISKTYQTTDDSIKHLTDVLEHSGTFNDGGTTIHKSSEYDITIVKCNTIAGNQNIYIGDYSMNYDSELMCK